MLLYIVPGGLYNTYLLRKHDLHGLLSGTVSLSPSFTRLQPVRLQQGVAQPANTGDSDGLSVWESVDQAMRAITDTSEFWPVPSVVADYIGGMRRV